MVLSLVTLIAAISLPSFGEWRRQALLRSQADAVAFDLQRLAILASQSRDKIRVTLHNDRYKAISSGGRELLSRKLMRGFEITEYASGDIYLSPSGVSSPSGIVISNGEKKCRITLSLRGRVQSDCS